MKKLWMLILLTTTMACSALSDRDPLVETVDVELEVSRFLATDDPIEEEQILQRLKRSQVSHNTLKGLISQKLIISPKNATGLQKGLIKKHNDRDYPYAIFVPEPAKDDEKPLPLMVLLHGMGGNGDNTIDAWIKRLDGEFIILCPSYPMGAWWTRNAEGLVLDLVNKIQAEYWVDPNRVFISGLSNGAIGAYMIGMFYPDQFAGIVPIAGAITPRYMHFLINLKNTPVYMIQGVHDPIFPISLSRRVNKILRDMKYSAIYKEHEKIGLAHGGHFLPEEEVPPLVQWLKEQKRPLNPKVVRMTREANHLARIHWLKVIKGVKMAALDIPGPDQKTTNIRDGKIATLFGVNKGNNEIEIMGKDLLEYEVYLNSDMVDFDKPVLISTQQIIEEKNHLITGEKEVSFHGKVEPDIELLLRDFKKHRDPNFLYSAKVTISLEKIFSRVHYHDLH
jgi:predicted esterase